MANILDLSVFKEQTLDIKLLDGTQINIKKPNQKFMIKLLGFKEEASKRSNSADSLELMKNLVLDVLNFNKNGRQFTAEDIADYDLVIQQAIIKAYTNFINEVMGNPN